MSILETGLILDGNLIINKQFYPSEEFLSNQMRTDLIHNILKLAEMGFHDDLNKISLGKYFILTLVSYVSSVVKDDPKKATLLLYCITDSIADEKIIYQEMQNTMDMFRNRFSDYDILEGNTKTFAKFEKRLEKNYKDLALKLEDRFKALY